MTDEFSTLPTGRDFKKGKIKSKLSSITARGESSIIHDSVEGISKQLGARDSYIRRSGLNRFQRTAIASYLKQKDKLSPTQYKMVKKLIDNYSTEEYKKKYLAKAGGKSKKQLAKQSGIRSRIEDYDREMDNESRPQASALQKRYGSSGFASQTSSGKSRISAVQNDGESFNPYSFIKEKGDRSSIRKKLRIGNKSTVSDFQKIGVSALAKSEKGSSSRIGVNKPTTGFAFGGRNGSPSGSPSKNSFAKPF